MSEIPEKIYYCSKNVRNRPLYASIVLITLNLIVIATYGFVHAGGFVVPFVLIAFHFYFRYFKVLTTFPYHFVINWKGKKFIKKPDVKGVEITKKRIVLRLESEATVEFPLRAFNKNQRDEVIDYFERLMNK